MDPIRLHETRRNLGECLVAKDRLQMDPQPVPVTLNVFRVPLAGRQRFVYLTERRGGEFERLTGL
jgi:hypothetical protein